MRESGRLYVVDRSKLDFSSLGEEQSILDIHAEVSDSVFDLRVSEQDLDRTDVSCRPVDQRRLCSPE
jgi:hypothetical protein